MSIDIFLKFVETNLNIGETSGIVVSGSSDYMRIINNRIDTDTR